MPTPADDGFFMPAEWAKHQRCWMAWPAREQTWGGKLDEALAAHAQVAKAVAEFEPVTMVCNPGDVADVSLMCGPGIEVVPIPVNDGWMRDTGPTFLIDGKGGVAGVDWGFNAWGGLRDDYETDAAIARQVLDHIKAPRYDSPLVLEGGGISVDGEGTLMTTEECLLDPGRNPGMTKLKAEEILRQYTGAERVIWLGKGYDKDETKGHVDEVACFAAPGVVLVQTTQDTGDPNFKITQDNLDRLRGATDAKGRKLEVVEIPQPSRRDEGGKRMTLSYINFYFANGALVVPAFEDANDTAAVKVFMRLFPDRKIVTVPAVDIVRGGGGIHCITQPQPVSAVKPAEMPAADTA